MTCLVQLDYIGLFLGTLKLSWALWWLLRAGERSPRGETLELLLTTHFPNSGVRQDLTAPVAALLARCPAWRLATKVVTYRRVEWAIDYLPHIKVDGIFPDLLQRARESVIPRLVRIFLTCLATGYV